MPIHTCTLLKGGKGFKWGGHGKCYPNESQAEKQAAAAHAAGFTESSNKAAGILFRCGNKVLLLKRSEEESEPGSWALPGGHVEQNETAIDAAIRELQEECGVTLDNPESLRLLAKAKGPIEYSTYEGIIDSPFTPRLNREHSDYGWFHMNELPYDVHPKLKPILEGYNK